MKLIQSVSYCALLLLFGSAAALANPAPAVAPAEDTGSRFELSALSNGSFFFNGSGSFGFAAAGASVQIIPGLQLSLDVGYLTVHAYSANTWAFGALAGPVINFPFEQDLRNAFFASAKYGAGVIGGTYITSGSDNSRGILDFSIGKRFKIFEHVSYTPEIGFSDVLGGGDSSDPTSSSSSTAFRVVFFGLSIFL